MERRKHYEDEGSQRISKVKVCMYYHYQEIGRSANTAHLFGALCPSATESIIFGDVAKEQQLVREIKREYDEGEPITCILYPDRSAVLLSEWIKNRPISCANKPVRMVGRVPFLRFDFRISFFKKGIDR
jgi:DTW domain-containing protein YfiP